MNCDAARMTMGAYLDGELPDGEAVPLQHHVAACPACTQELAALREMIDELEAEGSSEFSGSQVPPGLWGAIEARLEPRSEPAEPRRSIRLVKWAHRPMAMAASLAFLIGSAVFLAVWLNPAPQAAQATVIDYSVLLDGVASDVDRAFQRFVGHYGGKKMEPASAASVAPRLRFALPAEMAGGFRLEETYSLRFGNSPGVAARYLRGQEPLIVFFHSPVDKERLGVHRESHCEVAGRPGYCVETGPWRLIHFTDPTTCHCVLSKLTSEADLNAVMAAVSPDFDRYAGEHSHSH